MIIKTVKLEKRLAPCQCELFGQITTLYMHKIEPVWVLKAKLRQNNYD